MKMGRRVPPRRALEITLDMIPGEGSMAEMTEMTEKRADNKVTVTLDGKKLETNLIPPAGDGQLHQVKVTVE